MSNVCFGSENLLKKENIALSRFALSEGVMLREDEEGYFCEIPSGAFALGKWLIECPVEGGAVYDFSVRCRCALTEEDAYVLLTQYDENGRMPIREHAHTAKRDGDGIVFSEKLVCDKRTVRLCVELWLKGDGVCALWQDISLTRGVALPERRVRIAPVQAKSVGKSAEEQQQNILSALDRAGALRADIVVLGEGLYGRGLGFPLARRAEGEDGELSRLVREKARAYRMYIVYNTVEYESGAYYNTSYLFGRDGEVVGKYRKTHLPVAELEEGFTPGVGYPVFDLDFGRVGLLICYDQFFPRTAEALTMAGAELICIPSIGDMSHCSFARAMENGVYVAVSGANNENPHGFGATRVIDPLGRILAHTDEAFGIALCEVDLAERVRRFWMSTGPALSDVHDDYRFEKNSHSFQ